MATKPEIEEYEDGNGGDTEREFDVGIEDDGDVEIVGDEDEKPTAEERPSVEDQTPPEDAAKPKFRRADERVQTALKRAAEAEARAAQLAEELRKEREALTTERTAGVRSMEASLASELGAAKRRLADFHAIGDYEGIANATEEVGRLAGDLSAVKAYANQNKQVPASEQIPQNRPQQAQVDPTTRAWVESNPWFNPQSSEHDPELAVDAQAFARKLEIRLQREGKAAEIGSVAYFRQIDDYMAKTYPDVFEIEAAPQRKVPAMKADQNVAPVQRQNGPAGQSQKGRVIKLSAEQKDMAERFFPNLPREKAWATYAKGM